MLRTLTAAAALAALSTFAMSSAFAQAAAPAPKAKVATRKPAGKPAAEPVSALNDNLNPNQLSIADRVLTGDAECELKQKVKIEKIAGHSGNFKLVFDRKTYIMVPEETTTGAIRLVDTGGAVVWVQIPMKSMLMNQKEHHRMVDGCQADEQRIAVQSSQKAGVNAATVAPSVAGPAAVTPDAPVQRAAAAPTTAASGMWK